jgi:hypothetical protein
MQANLTHILPLTTIRRARALPMRGKVLVHAGQKVNASDIVAECTLPGRHVLLDVRRALGLTRATALKDVLERTVGERVQKGDIIAQTGGMFSRVVRAPEDCEIVAIQRGMVMLECERKTFSLSAGSSGLVTEAMPEQGVVIETNGALIQGQWGNGRIDMGLLQILCKTPEEELTRPQLDMTLRGAVVVSGFCANPDALQAAAELPVRGLVLGSLTADLLSTARAMDYPIMLLEGFGRMPMNPVAYKLLAAQTKRDVSINATFSAESGERPELVVPLPGQGKPLSDTVEFKPAQQVKVLTPPYMSQTGVVVSIRPGLTLLPNGLRAQAAEIRLETGELVILPLANLTVIE